MSKWTIANLSDLSAPFVAGSYASNECGFQRWFLEDVGANKISILRTWLNRSVHTPIYLGPQP